MDQKNKAVVDYSRALEINPDFLLSGKLRDEIAQISANDDQTIEYYSIMPMNSNIQRQECKTKAEWNNIEKTLEYRRDIIHGPSFTYFIDKLQGP